jgi:hypothetical protein
MPIWRDCRPPNRWFIPPVLRDGCVDRSDYGILTGCVRGTEPCDATHDLNLDGEINRADIRTLIDGFTNPRGAARNGI